ncbi:hypothetical protein EDD15DRAFT_2269905 [Pisolithus albus]|nr:hypothetical protein EDD15DRAFT_2269905 [Pisolithus albus]
MFLVDCVNVTLQLLCFAARSQSPDGRAATAVYRTSRLRVDIEPEASDEQSTLEFETRERFERKSGGQKSPYAIRVSATESSPLTSNVRMCTLGALLIAISLHAQRGRRT